MTERACSTCGSSRVNRVRVHRLDNLNRPCAWALDRLPCGCPEVRDVCEDCLEQRIEAARAERGEQPSAGDIAAASDLKNYLDRALKAHAEKSRKQAGKTKSRL